MKQVKVSELSGAALDYCVAQCEGYVGHDAEGYLQWPDNYSSDWAQGGPIIEREGINIDMNVVRMWQGKVARPSGFYKGLGKTPLQAAMRCYVASKLGDVVELPEELC